MSDRGKPRGTGPARSLRLVRYGARFFLVFVLGRAAITAGSAEDRIAERRTSAGATIGASNTSGTPGRVPSRATIAQYQAHCAICHDPDGRGASGRDASRNIPDFTNEAWQSSQADAQLRRAIHEGQGKVMPRFRGKLGPGDVENLVALVRRFRGGRWVAPEDETDSPEAAPRPSPTTAAAPDAPPAPSWRAERAIFHQACQLCHGPDGRGAPDGGRLAGVPDFTNPSWQAGRSEARLAASILEGRGRMPGFRDKLGTEQVASLAAFVRSLGPAPARPPAVAPGDFDRRLARLRREFEELRRAYRDVSPPTPGDRP